jgi:probable phosphomutase (TIGR03848 family)
MPRPAPPSPTVVLLVRHGLTPTTGKVLPGRAPGLHLADAGVAQAQGVGERLAAWASASGNSSNGKTPGRIAAVYCSPLERTRETAAPIGQALGLTVKVERGLIECDYGAWTGRSIKSLVKLPEWTTIQRYPSGFRFPDGESLVAMQTRLVETVRELCRRHPGTAVVAVSHADPIKATVAHALGVHLDLFQRISIAPCSVTAIAFGTGGPAVLTVNATGSLADSLGQPTPASRPGRAATRKAGAA